jgi:hypothetical protein
MEWLKLPEQVQPWKIRENSTDRLANLLELNGKVYIPLPEFGNFDQLVRIISD